MQLSHLQKLSVTAAAALLVLGLFAGVSYYYASRLVAADRAVERANGMIASAFRVVVARQDGERAAKAYVVRADSAARHAMTDAQTRVEEALDAMTRASEDNPHQRTDVNDLGRLAASNFEAFRATLLIRDHAGADSARRFLNGDLRALAEDSVLKLADEIRDEELRVLAERTRVQSEHGENAQRIILIGMVLTFLFAGVALQPMRTDVAARITKRLVREQAATAAPGEAPDGAGKAAAQLLGVHRLVAALAESRDATAGARAIVAATPALLDVMFAAVIVPNGAGGFTVLAASHDGFDAVGDGLADAAAATLRAGSAAMAESRAERERQWGAFPALDTAGARGAVLFVPLSREGAVSGVLLAARATDELFDDDVLSCAATLGRLGGPAVAARSSTP